MAYLVKRDGRQETYDGQKVYASAYGACLASRLSRREAELVASNVTSALDVWIELRPMVTAEEIFHRVAEELTWCHSDVGYLYRYHRNVA